jgi:arylsulfatase A-like enzyme
VESGETPPHFVLVTLDTLRADHLQSYGYFRQTSPHFDRFADEGLLFQRAFAPIATTLPSHVSLLTGTHPLRHGVVSNRVHFEPPAAPAPRSAAQMLREAGYQTAAFTSAAPLAPGSGIESGFERFQGPPPREVLVRRGLLGARAEQTVEAALRWLAEVDATRPLFLWVHLFDPHGPYDPPPPFDTAFAVQPELLRFLRVRGLGGAPLARAAALSNRYDGEILYADGELGRLFEGLRAAGVYPRAVVVVAGDHGEGILQHGLLEHGQLWNEQLAVPLALRWPGGPRGRSTALASLIDVLPTLAAHTRLPLDASQFDGVDLLAGSRDALLSQRPLRRGAPERELALRRGRWKYWREGAGPARLYDLADDPHELRDLRDAHPELSRSLEAELGRRVAAERSRPGLVTREPGDAALDEQLRALGYVE